MIIAGTGHRPDKLAGYGEDGLVKLTDFAQQELRRLNAHTVISGMALGWDTAIALASIELHIPFIAAVPFKDHEARWSAADRAIFIMLLEKARKVEIVCGGGFAYHKYQIRNRWMVDRCDKVLALWDGSQSGTANCVAYANERRPPVEVENVWIRWQQYQGRQTAIS